MKAKSQITTGYRLVMLVALALVVLAALSWIGAKPVAAQAGSTAVVTTGRLNVRTGPGPGYGIIATLSQGDTVTMLGRDSALWWVYIEMAGGLKGWVTSLYLDYDVLLSSLPIMAQAQPWAIVTAPMLNVRSGPGTTYGVVTNVSQGALITLVGRTADNAYADILTNGIAGWVSTAYIRASGPISSLPVTWTAPTQPTAPPSGAPTATPIATPRATPTPTLPTGVVTTGRLNVRTGPGPGYSVLATLSQGDSVLLLGRTSDLSWLLVQTDGGVEGWVSERYIDANVPITSLPTVAPGEPWAIVTTPVLNVRSGPGSDFSVLTTVNEGRLITLIARTVDNAWVQIRTDDIVGWVSTLYIDANVPISSLPLSTD